MRRGSRSPLRRRTCPGLGVIRLILLAGNQRVGALADVERSLYPDCYCTTGSKKLCGLRPELLHVEPVCLEEREQVVDMDCNQQILKLHPSPYRFQIVALYSNEKAEHG